MTEYVPATELKKILGDMFSRRALKHMLEHEDVLPKVVKIKHKRYVPIDWFLSWCAERFVNSKSRIHPPGEQEEVRKLVVELLQESRALPMAAIARETGKTLSQVQGALEYLKGLGVVMRVPGGGGRWRLGDSRTLGYPAVPPHCLGKSGGWWGE